MSVRREPTAARRRVIPSVIGGAGGAAYVVINASSFDTMTSIILRIVAVGTLLWVLVRAWRLRRRRRSGRPGHNGFGKAYWTIVALEVVLIVGGRAVIVGLLGAPHDFLPWIGLVVGLHFLAFVALWRKRVYLWLGLLITASAVAAFVLVAIGAPVAAVAVFSAGIPGVALLTVGVAGVESAAAAQHTVSATPEPLYEPHSLHHGPPS